MSEKARAYALLIPMGAIVFGLLTAWPALFTFLGIALYVALMREMFKHTIPWPWARRLLRLDSVQDAANHSPPPPAGVRKIEETHVTELGNGAGYVVYPPGHVRRYDA
jgi:hypothetical protein